MEPLPPARDQRIHRRLPRAATVACVTGTLMIALGVQGVAAIDSDLETAREQPTRESLRGEGVVRGQADRAERERRAVCAEKRREREAERERL